MSVATLGRSCKTHPMVHPGRRWLAGRLQEDQAALVDRRVAVPATERQYHIALGPGEVAD
jgi:hypothetical protein